MFEKALDSTNGYKRGGGGAGDDTKRMSKYGGFQLGGSAALGGSIINGGAGNKVPGVSNERVAITGKFTTQSTF